MAEETGGKSKRAFRAEEKAEGETPIAKAKGGKLPLTKRPKGPKVTIAVVRKPKAVSTPNPYDYEDAEGTAPPQGTPAPSTPPPPPPPNGAMLAKGGTAKACGGKMAKGGDVAAAEKKPEVVIKKAAGGAAKERKGFPNTQKPPKAQKFAKGGLKRGTGAARRGLRFSGIY